MDLDHVLDSHPRSGVLTLRILQPPVPHEVPLRFVTSDGAVFILAPADPPPAWAKVLAEDRPPLYWRIGSKGYLGTAHAIDDPQELATVRSRFEAVDGEATVRGWFGARLHGFALQVFETDQSDYSILVQRYFDALSASYDKIVDGNPFDSRLRSVARGILLGAFKPGQVVVEIGAGTGLETLPLARQGIRVVATDISQGMLDRLGEKARREGLQDAISTRRLRAGNLSALLEEFGPSAFDGAFSNFGALNCEPELARIPSILADLVHRQGRMVLGVWNRVCIAEMAAYMLVVRPRRAFARLLDPVPVGSSRFGIPTFAYPFAGFVEAFSPFFRLERATGLPVFLPPYDLAKRLQGHARLVATLESADRRLAGHAPFNRLGDHFVLEFQRR